jgi:hypothetical protein
MGAITVASVGAFTTILCTVAIAVYWNTTIMRYKHLTARPGTTYQI